MDLSYFSDLEFFIDLFVENWRVFLSILVTFDLFLVNLLTWYCFL